MLPRRTQPVRAAHGHPVWLRQASFHEAASRDAKVCGSQHVFCLALFARPQPVALEQHHCLPQALRAVPNFCIGPESQRDLAPIASVSKFANLIPAIDAIEAFGFWLRHSRPGWSASRPAVERLESGECHPIFVLYQQGVSVGVYRTPMDALARIGDDDLTREYLMIISNPDG